jgi:tRNA pseudouridine13 synthase
MAWTPPARERELGLGFYASGTAGIGGHLKDRAESFQVREISLYPVPDPEGRYTVLRVISRNWEQHELGDRLSRLLRLGPHALSWAGTKDRRAVAERLASFRGLPPEGPLDLAGVEIVEAYRARDGLVLGHHFGNAFEVRVGGVDPGAADPVVRGILGELRAFGGIPNLFGLQRFGDVRPITHRVGQALVRGDVAGAVELYLAERTEDGDPRGNEARALYAAHHDPVRALREFPREFRFERQLLDHLARGNSPARALRALSRELRQLFVHAYQAWLFNRYLTARWSAQLPFHEPVVGDRLLRVARDGTVPGRDPVPVGSDNLPEARETVQRGRAVVAGPLLGFATPTLDGRPAELLGAILEREAIRPEQFRLPAVPEVASEGTYRPILLPVPPIACRPEENGTAHEGSKDAALWFRFALPKGAYATVLLREFRKEGAVLAEATARTIA